MSDSVADYAQDEGPDRDGLDIAYEPLDSLRFETRLLLLHGITDDGMLKCELVRNSLIKPRIYAALSYRWDESYGKADILIGDTNVSIAKSLEYALQQIRRHGESCVWVDAICVNQSDDIEKGAQVRIMGKIYSQAYMVWISLGFAKDDSDRAMQAFKTALAQLKDGQPFVPSSKDIEAMIALIKRPYFKRAWIIQEIAKAEQRNIICGDKMVSWLALERALETLDANLLPHYPRERLKQLAQFRRGELEGKMGLPRILLLQAIVRGRRSLAKRPRDKIYCLLGLTRDGDEVVPAPHYDGNIRDIHIQVARHFVVRQGLTSSLLLTRMTDSKGELPSWTTRWSSLPWDTPTWLLDAVAAERETLHLHRRYLSQDDEITVRGIVLETITVCSNQDASQDEVSNDEKSKLSSPDPHILKNLYCTVAMISEPECPPEYMEALLRPEDDVAPPSSENTAYVEWFAESRRSLFGTKALEDKFADLHLSKRLSGGELPTGVAAASKLLKKGIRHLAHHDMKIVWTERGMSRAVYQAARVDDKICRLENCFLPIVLRGVGEGKYQCVGEVYIPYTRRPKPDIDVSTSGSTAALSHAELRATYWLCENGWGRTKFGPKDLITIV